MYLLSLNQRPSESIRNERKSNEKGDQNSILGICLRFPVNIFKCTIVGDGRFHNTFFYVLLRLTRVGPEQVSFLGASTRKQLFLSVSIKIG